MDVSLVSQATPLAATVAIPYQDTYHVAIGGQYRPNPDWLLNGRFAFDSSMVKDQDRPLSMPTGATYKFGMGVQWQSSPITKLGFSYELVYLGDLPVSKNCGKIGK